MGEHAKEKQRADEHERRAEQEAKRGDELRVEMLRERYVKDRCCQVKRGA